MKKTIVTALVIAALSSTQALAGGWGGSSSFSSGLVNVSPSVNLGDVTALNGIAVLNGSPILSGNGILSGNSVGILNQSTGILNGVGVNILNSKKKFGR